MAPSHSRQLLVWTFPTIAILLSYLWFKRKRIGVRSDPGGVNADNSEEGLLLPRAETKGIVEETPVEIPQQQSSAKATPEKKFSRSLSGVETAPIDIIIPRELRSVKSNPIVISDEDLDLEIEKIKSMKNETFKRSRALNSSNTTTTITTTTSSNNTSKDTNEKTPPKQNSETPVKKVETTKTTPIKATEKATPNKTAERKLDMVEKKVEGADKMAQDMVRVEQKLNNLKLGMNNNQSSKKKGKKGGNKGGKNVKLTNEREELQRQSSERDSANHSPADVMLASPSLSSISDNHSEGSNDSGKGGSDVATPPSSRTPAGDGIVTDDVAVPIVYEFVIPQQLVGRLIGRFGCFVTEIKEKTHAHILIKKHPTNNKLKVCAIEGTQLEVDNALRLIRDKFPQKRYPEVTLERVSFIQPITPVPLVADHLYMKLIEGINNDTILSCIVTPRHLFLQQPAHPTFPNLNILTEHLNMCYSETETPSLPKPIPENSVCVAHSVGLWYRAMVLSTDDESDRSYVKFLDYGGYAYVENSMLRQIRGDFVILPFQATECYLADIKPAGDSGNWEKEAYDHIAKMAYNCLIYTQIVSYSDDGIPLVHCYIAVGPQKFIFLNEDLVNNGYAQWIEQPEAAAASDEVLEGAVGGIEQ